MSHLRGSITKVKEVLMTIGTLVIMFLLGVGVGGALAYETIEVPKEDAFERVLNQNANARPYEMGVYDCTEFAKNVAHDLNELGWEAEDIHVDVNCSSGLFENISCQKYGGGHRIVRVDKIYVEAVSGHIIAPWDYKAYGIN